VSAEESAERGGISRPSVTTILRTQSLFLRRLVTIPGGKAWRGDKGIENGNGKMNRSNHGLYAASTAGAETPQGPPYRGARGRDPEREVEVRIGPRVGRAREVHCRSRDAMLAHIVGGINPPDIVATSMDRDRRSNLMTGARRHGDRFAPRPPLLDLSRARLDTVDLAGVPRRGPTPGRTVRDDRSSCRCPFSIPWSPRHAFRPDGDESPQEQARVRGTCRDRRPGECARSRAIIRRTRAGPRRARRSGHSPRAAGPDLAVNAVVDASGRG